MNKLRVLEVTKEPTGLPGFFALKFDWAPEVLSVILKDNLITEDEKEFDDACKDFLDKQIKLYGNYNRYTFSYNGMYYSEIGLGEIVKYFSARTECTQDFVRTVLAGKPFATVRDLARTASGVVLSSWVESEKYLLGQNDITLQHLTDSLGDISQHILNQAKCLLILSTTSGLIKNRVPATSRGNRVADIQGSKYVIALSDDQMVLTPVLARATYDTFANFRAIATQLGSETHTITLPATGLDNISGVSLMELSTLASGIVTLSYGMSVMQLPQVCIGERTPNNVIKSILIANGSSKKGLTVAKREVLIDRLVELVDKKITVPVIKKKYIALHQDGIYQQPFQPSRTHDYKPKLASFFGLECMTDLTYSYRDPFTGSLDTLIFNNLLLFVMLYKHLKGGIIFDVNYNNEAYTTHNIVSGLIKGSIPTPTALLEVK